MALHYKNGKYVGGCQTQILGFLFLFLWVFILVATTSNRKVENFVGNTVGVILGFLFLIILLGILLFILACIYEYFFGKDKSKKN